jgi:hypothetical protein
MTSVYAALAKRNEQRRAALRAVSPTPPAVNGSVFMNPLVTALSREELYNRGMKSWTIVAMGSIVTAAGEYGWRKYFDLMDEYQRAGMKRTGDELTKDFDIRGDTVLDCQKLVTVWSKGCGFGNSTYDFSVNGGLWAGGPVCPQIEALHALEMTDEIGNLHMWCDSYDNLIGQACNLDCHYSHVQCIGKGDLYCKYFARLDTSSEPDESFGGKVLRLSADARVREEAAGSPAPFLAGIGYTSQVVRDGWTPEMRWRDGVTTKGRIAHDNIFLGVKALGWEKYLGLVDQQLGDRMAHHAVRVREELDSRGNTLRDAANLALFAYTSMGFHWHTLAEYSDLRVELVADRCPIMDSAEHMGVTDCMQDMPLWCDWHHNHYVQAVSREVELVHTHCLGRGDTYCRVCMERKA